MLITSALNQHSIAHLCTHLSRPSCPLAIVALGTDVGASLIKLAVLDAQGRTHQFTVKLYRKPLAKNTKALTMLKNVAAADHQTGCSQ